MHARRCAPGCTASPTTSASTCSRAPSGARARWTSVRRRPPRRRSARPSSSRPGSCRSRTPASCPTDGDPAEMAAAKETIKLAFVAALQLLPPKQRAVLILREVLKWQASEVAELLDTSVASVNSALQRARATIDASDLDASTTPSDVDGDEERDLLARYVDAFESYDVSAFVALLSEDAQFSMPPYDLWLRGPRAGGPVAARPGLRVQGLAARPAAGERLARLRAVQALRRAGRAQSRGRSSSSRRTASASRRSAASSVTRASRPSACPSSCATPRRRRRPLAASVSGASACRVRRRPASRGGRGSASAWPPARPRASRPRPRRPSSPGRDGCAWASAPPPSPSPSPRRASSSRERGGCAWASSPRREPPRRPASPRPPAPRPSSPGAGACAWASAPLRSRSLRRGRRRLRLLGGRDLLRGLPGPRAARALGLREGVGVGSNTKLKFEAG